MRLIKLITIVFALSVFCEAKEDLVTKVVSPDGKVEIMVAVSEVGVPQYSVRYDGEGLILSSPLGLKMSGEASFVEGLAITSTSTYTQNEVWKPLVGERSEVRNRFNELTVDLVGEDEKRLLVKFRAYDEGAAFCYEVPKQAKLDEFVIKEEMSEFHFAGDYPCWDTKDPQAVYQRIPLSKIGSDCERPLVVEVSDGPYVALGEARLVDYARLRFKNGEKPQSVGVELGSEVKATAPFASPWRYVMIGDTPGELIENNDLVRNLNDPCAILDTSWIKPGKTIRSELNTERCLETIDFIGEMNCQYLLIDAGWYGAENSEESDATTVTIDPKRYSGPLDLQKVIDYGKEKGVGVILYVNRRALERQLDELLPLFKKWGVAGIKFGFVNVGSQKWTKWVHDSVKKCADYQMVVDIHDDYRPTGWSRTYPNLLTQEGIKGNETMPTAEENVILPFTRYLCGAADYTVCYYSSRIKTTRAHQLAASIVYYSPIQLLFWYDRPSQYKGEPELEVFQELHATWDETKILQGEIGKFITTARRNGDRWFVGSMNAGEQRKLQIPLTFLEPGVRYKAVLNSDQSPEGDAPKKVSREVKTVTSETILTAEMADNGGQAIVLTPLSEVGK